MSHGGPSGIGSSSGGGAAGGSAHSGGTVSAKAAGAAKPLSSANNSDEDLKRSEAFFGISPVRFVDDVYNCASMYIKQATDQMEGAMLDDEDTRGYHDEVKEGVGRASSTLYAALDKNIDKFELYIVRNIFKVPEHLDLDTGSTLQLPGASTRTHQTLDTLRSRLQQAGYVNSAMTNRMQELDAQLAAFAQVEETFAATDRMVAEGAAELEGGFEGGVGGVLQLGPEQLSLLKQYEALESAQAQAQPPPPQSQAVGAAGGSGGKAAAQAPEAASDTQGVDNAFARCRADLGASTRDFTLLGKVLGT
ncbi:Mis12 protein-domain-containing protein [Baffinella frigidus]|nr:Mis12 protein-domain-containing protein [Cryptophyta sp. CCMP2293]